MEITCYTGNTFVAIIKGVTCRAERMCGGQFLLMVHVEGNSEYIHDAFWGDAGNSMKDAVNKLMQVAGFQSTKEGEV